MTVFVTGAAGFVGQRLCAQLHSMKGWRLIGLVRQAPNAELVESLDDVVIADLCQKPDLQASLVGIDVIVHLASRVHNMKGKASLAAYRASNVEAARHLVNEAVRARVKRLIFVSTVKVNGEETTVQPFSGDQAPAPEDAYAQSKLEAEEEIRRIAKGTDLEVVILRPPLVYGPGVRANFLSLLRLASRSWPLPLGSVRNKRSILHVDNLIDAIVVAATSPAAANRTFTISDDGSVSTPDLVKKLGAGMGRQPKLIPFPVCALKFFGRLFGLSRQVSRLIVSLEADNSKFKAVTGWKPGKSTDEGLRETVSWFMKRTEP